MDATSPEGYNAVVIGASAGGLQALMGLLSPLPEDYGLPIIIVQHRSKEQRNLLEEVLQQRCHLKIKQADEKEEIHAGAVYIAPPDYHLLVERDKTFSLSVGPYVKFSRPSIDVLFESAAEVYKQQLIGIILTGANDDGANGICAIHHFNGLTIAQNPDEAEYAIMPSAAVKTGTVDRILSLHDIKEFLVQVERRTYNGVQ